MAVQFILGRSGTGKTHHCVTAIVEALLQQENQQLLYLVPEQATYQASAAILKNPRIAGYNRLHVLSFDRLAYLVSGQKARPAITRLGRTMVIQRILRDCAARLTIFGDSAKLPGLGKRLAETITQLQQYANTPDDIENLAQKLQKQARDNLTAAKFADIAVVFKDYLKFIEGKFLDPEIQLASACKAVAKADFIRGAKLWVDGFAGFTTGELALLTELLKVVEDAQIALCLDPNAVNLANPDKSQIDPTDLFGLTAQTYTELVERIKKCKLNLSRPMILDKPRRFAKSPPLAHIERNIFTSQPAKIPAEGKIRVVSAPNARAEVQFIARQITKLVREAGCRYRDIAVIASDIDRYENYIKACFEDYQIPVFIDKRRPLNQHSVIEFLCSAFAAVVNDFPNNDILAYLKTDLADISRDDAHLLENYCIAFGITASDWHSTKPWRFAAERAEQFNEPQVNQIRQKVINPLRELKNKIEASKDSLTAEKFTKIVFGFLETTGVRNQLAEWVEEAFQKGNYAAADEHRQLYDRLVDVLDELNDAFAGVSLGFPDYLEILRCAFSQITLAFIPPALDQVLVGSIERSRHPDLKAVFLVGTTERQFPAPVAFDSILSEDDRLTAIDSGLELSPGVRQELANRPYLAYIAFTRASDLLCITYPAIDQKSNAVVRSPFIDNLCLLFEDLKEESVSPALPAFEEVFSQYDLEDMLCTLKDKRLLTLGPRVARALGYENKAELDDNIVGKLFASQITSSSSRLSTFAACPFKHFTRYVLELEKRDEFKLEPLDVGDFYHRVLDGFTKRVVAEKIHFETVQPPVLTKILDEEIERLCQQDSFISKFASHSPHNSFRIESAREYLHDYLLDILQMIRAGSFRPAASEAAFGRSTSPDETIGRLSIPLGDGRQLLLNGRIDRIDVAQINKQSVALIFDYKKRSKKSFSWAEFFHGLDIQLPVYILAALKSSDARKIAAEVAGAFYLPIETGPEPAPLNEITEDTGKPLRKAKGIFNGTYSNHLDSSVTSGWSTFYSFRVSEEKGQYANYNTSSALNPDDFEAVLKFGEGKIAEIAQQIFSGRIDVRPYRLSGKSPCADCEYKPVCRFDWQINDYNLLAGLGKQQALEKINPPAAGKKDR